MGKLGIGIWAQSLIYVASGINHFVHPAFYVHIMPDHYTHPETLVLLSGWAELLGGLGLLVPATRRVAAFGLVAMLVVFLDVHVFMLRHAALFPGVPRFVLWARLPLQGILIVWAAWYARRKNPEFRRSLG